MTSNEPHPSELQQRFQTALNNAIARGARPRPDTGLGRPHTVTTVAQRPPRRHSLTHRRLPPRTTLTTETATVSTLTVNKPLRTAIYTENLTDTRRRRFLDAGTKRRTTFIADRSPLS